MGRGRASKSMRQQSRANISGRSSRGNSHISMSNSHGKKLSKRPTKAQLKEEGWEGGKQSIIEVDGKKWQVVEEYCEEMKMYFPTKAYQIQGAGVPLKDGCKSSRDQNSERLKEIRADPSEFRDIAEKWATNRGITEDTIVKCFISHVSKVGYIRNIETISGLNMNYVA